MPTRKRPARRPHPPASVPDYRLSVFINCPYDPDYRPLFQAIIFAIQDCGFRARCALEVQDSGEVRVAKIIRIIKECRLGIHDISRTELNEEKLPRFNMPYELGLFIGCTVYGSVPHADKKSLILDREPHRYIRFLSDIAGQDIQHHGAAPAEAIRIVRNWLATLSSDRLIPGGDTITARYDAFRAELPKRAAAIGLTLRDLENFVDFHNCVTLWLVGQDRTTPMP